MDANEVVKWIRDREIQVVDLRFVDLPGLWQHFTVAANQITEESFTEGFGFDGSSIRGFQQIQESDMLLFPDPNSGFEDPFTEARTLNLICNVGDPVTGEPYSRDPRFIAQKAEKYLVSTGLADTAYFGPEPEFFILDEVRF
ncbi:MAG: type I glutamate--ammonia ligase, partial [Acidobacteria bacterium]